MFADGLRISKSDDQNYCGSCGSILSSSIFCEGRYYGRPYMYNLSNKNYRLDRAFNVAILLSFAQSIRSEIMGSLQTQLIDPYFTFIIYLPKGKLINQL